MPGRSITRTTWSSLGRSGWIEWDALLKEIDRHVTGGFWATYRLQLATVEDFWFDAGRLMGWRISFGVHDYCSLDAVLLSRMIEK